MFDEKCYQDLRSCEYFHGFARNCFIGFLVTYTIGILIAAGILLASLSFSEDVDIRSAFMILLLVFAVGFIVTAFVIYRCLYKKLPYLCTVGVITEKSEKKAVVKVNDQTFSSISFERFLTNSDLSDYEIGDKVIIYAGDKKATRPMFYHCK